MITLIDSEGGSAYSVEKADEAWLSQPIPRARRDLYRKRAHEMVGELIVELGGRPPLEISRRCRECFSRAHGAVVLSGGDPGYAASISYAAAHIAVAVSGAGRIGIDVEDLDSLPDDDRLDSFARAFLTTDEALKWRSLNAPSRRDSAVSMWTRKEAILKLAGVGLSRDPRELSVATASIDGRPVARDGIVLRTVTPDFRLTGTVALELAHRGGKHEV